MRYWKRISIVLILQATNICVIFAEKYSSNIGLEITYDGNAKISESISDVSFTEPLIKLNRINYPIKPSEEFTMGYTNDNLKQMLTDLTTGELKCFPFNYPKMSSMKNINGRWLILGYYLRMFSEDDISLSTIILFSKGNDIYEIVIDYYCYAKKLPIDYPEYFEKMNIGNKWKTSNGKDYPKMFISEIRKDAKAFYISEMASNIETIINNIVIKN